MKEMYICERCGKMFESYRECFDCESSHREIDYYSDYVHELQKRSRWKTGGKLPSMLVLNSQACSVYNDETGTYEDEKPIFGAYELKRVLGTDEVDAIIAEQAERIAEDRRRYESYSVQTSESASDTSMQSA